MMPKNRKEMIKRHIYISVLINLRQEKKCKEEREAYILVSESDEEDDDDAMDEYSRRLNMFQDV